jgi:hypothetical protein
MYERGNNPMSAIHVTYNGKLILLDELPAAQFNSPWVVTYTHSAQMGDNLRLNGVA